MLNGYHTEKPLLSPVGKTPQLDCRLDKTEEPSQRVCHFYTNFPNYCLMRKLENPSKMHAAIIQKDTCTPMFIAALFTIARTWKQPKCPPTDEWIKKMWQINTMEYYSAIKRNEMEVFVMRWMELESVIQSEVSQKEKNNYSMILLICGIQKNDTDELICKAEMETQG